MNRLFVTLTMFAAAFAAWSAPVRVACIGNSITFGYTLPEPSTQSYPAQLQQMLGPEYVVGNFGHSGATLMRHGHRPYTALPEWRAAKAFDADIAVIHLGVNDTDPRNWPEYGDEFLPDYCALIDTLRSINPRMRIIVANLSPLCASHWRFRTGTRQWRDDIRSAIAKLPAARGVELIDFDTPLHHRQELIHDGIHPNIEGSRLLARTAYGAITGRYGGLRLPELWQPGMVVQRHRPLHIEGTADASTPLTVSIGGATYSTVADNLGHWSILAAPLSAGNYSLRVSSPDTTITIPDIAAGELWIAAGQSNMAFEVQQSAESHQILAAPDSLIRFYDMRPRALTNAYLWPDSVHRAVDTLNHYLPARWQRVSDKNLPRLSAVAYNFARTLRDSLGSDVPIGIVSCAVGGSTTESWVDVERLQKVMPEILVNWRKGDYGQPWARKRADENSPLPHRHPYDPGYLFASAIAPLGRPDIAGVLWYQGESNADKPQIHEVLFRTMVEGFRSEFHNPNLPLMMVQLSGMNRPSWPVFRNSQRLLADSLEGVFMAVCSDLGHPTDVHPWRKRPVGHRLALQALRNVYGHSNVVAHGPEPLSAVVTAPHTIEVTFDTQGAPLTLSHGEAPTMFEITDATGLWQQADAVISSSNTVKLKNMNISNPTYVRYGWRPYCPDANLACGKDTLPASTFQIPVVNTICENSIEDGMEYGVSGAFGARYGSNMVVAGGCNFPCPDPFAPEATKTFYRGIYLSPLPDAAHGVRPQIQWRRIGSLPEASGYGAMVPLEDGRLLIIGGTPQGNSTSAVYAMSIDGVSVANLMPMPSLPTTLDNFAAAEINGTVYVAGGNANGIPSRMIYSLAPGAKTWRKLAQMPGNPRVQPVMWASQKQNALYIFGGFAPRHGKNNPTVEADGLRYDIAKGKFEVVKGPRIPGTDTPISLGGASCATTSDGDMAATGGVNYHVFLDALTAQASDYLEHPIEWYRFNGRPLIFDPVQRTWTIGEQNADAARAGAVMIPDLDGGWLLWGGELKPRVRTPQILHAK